MIQLLNDFIIGDFLLKNYVNLTIKESLEVLEWRNHPDIRQWMFSTNIINNKEHLSFIKSLTNNKKNYYWKVLYKKKGVGAINFINFDYNNMHSSWGFFLSPSMLGSGLGLVLEYIFINFAFEKVNLHCLRGEILENNIKTIKLHDYFGFKRDGIIRDYLFDPTTHSGTNLILNSMTKEEWLLKKGDYLKYASKFL
jgi:UDP-4-amino-4,6-dideoxy-N-acetyl-beta-L-altrosamine N-acetyltransferase